MGRYRMRRRILEKSGTPKHGGGFFFVVPPRSFMAFADRSWSFVQDVQEISRFSCMLFLSVPGFSDYAGPTSHSRLAWLPCCFPPYRNEVGILFLRLFEAQ